jgi:hypothetical protein
MKIFISKNTQTKELIFLPCFIKEDRSLPTWTNPIKMLDGVKIVLILLRKKVILNK